MSVESQAILVGHVPVDRIVRLLKAEVSGPVTVRDMQRPEYKIIEFQRVDGSWVALNLFLNSWAADDYADAFQGPSTFMTAEYSPQNFSLVRSIAAGIGGLARKAATEPWVELEPARI
jgi:hypothetical protein